MKRPTRQLPGVGPALIGAVCAAALLSACGVPVDRDASPVPAEDVPYELLDETTTSQVATNAQGGDTSICLTAESKVLALPRSRDGEPPLDSLLAVVVAGPTEGEATLGIRSALTGDEPVISVTRQGGDAEVELGADFTDLPADQQLLAVAQVTCALTAQPGVQRVSFLFEERQIEVPVQGGSLVARPVTREDYRELFVN